MPSTRGKVDRLDYSFLLARTGFLLLGALATALLTVWVPAFHELENSWAPMIAMALTAVAELLNRVVRDNTRLPMILFACLLCGAVAITSVAGVASAGELLRELPTEAKEHTLIEMQGTDGQSWAWILKRTQDGHRPMIRTFDAGRTCIWTGPPGTYDIDVIALQDGVLVQEYAQLVIVPHAPPKPDPSPGPQPGPQPGPSPGPDPSPGPSPEPQPDPTPPPTLPDDPWGVAKLVYTEAVKIPAAARGKAGELADNFDAVAAGIHAGQFRNGGFQAAQKTIAESNQQTLGSERAAWDPLFTRLHTHTQERRVPTTLAAYADLYAAIAAGLRAAK